LVSRARYIETSGHDVNFSIAFTATQKQDSGSFSFYVSFLFDELMAIAHNQTRTLPRKGREELERQRK
jgi:hypothetical protein